MSDINSTNPMHDKILADAKEEAQRILSEAENKAREIMLQAKTMTEERKTIDENQMRKGIEQNRREQISEETTEQKRRLQLFKTGIVNNVFDEALKRLEKYSDSKQYVGKLKELIVEAGVTLGGGELVFSTSAKDHALATKQFLQEISKTVEKKTGKRTVLKLTLDHLESTGGAVVWKADGSANINNTFEERLRRTKETMTSELETIIFR